MSTILLLFGLYALAVLAAACFLLLGMRLSGVPRRSLARAVLAICLASLVWLVLGVGTNFLPLAFLSSMTIWLIWITAGSVGLLLTWLISRVVLGATLPQTMVSWAPTLVPVVCSFLVALLVIRPYVVEASFQLTNDMSPTILARHHEGTCPLCGEAAYVPFQLILLNESPDERLGICGHCQKCVRIADTGADVFTYDRFLVNKLLPLRRWDLVLYRAPHKQEGTVRFVKRLVGLPGEQVVIKEGAVWINGERMEAPEDIAGLEYQTQIESIGSMVPARWGTPENPAVLGPDEYFVLGDFTLRSHDCRMWHRGVGDHPPYALPYDHIEGVVTLVYWPQSRWRLIR